MLIMLSPTLLINAQNTGDSLPKYIDEIDLWLSYIDLAIMYYVYIVAYAYGNTQGQ